MADPPAIAGTEFAVSTPPPSGYYAWKGAMMKTFERELTAGAQPRRRGEEQPAPDRTHEPSDDRLMEDEQEDHDLDDDEDELDDD
jgi:hypothetical protein